MSQCGGIGGPASRPLYQVHYVACPPALQDKLFELLPNWQTYGRTFFTVTPKSRLAAPRPRAFIEFLLASPLRPGM
ncbi:hypothetical protein D3C78_554300 [compost metagenome]